MNPKLFWLITAFLLVLFPQAQAEQPKKITRIGWLAGNLPYGQKSRIEVFRQALRELGYTEGRDVIIEACYNRGKLDQLPELAAELVRLAANGVGPPEVTIRSTFRRTSSAANSCNRSFFCSANRYSMLMFSHRISICRWAAGATATPRGRVGQRQIRGYCYDRHSANASRKECDGDDSRRLCVRCGPDWFGSGCQPCATGREHNRVFNDERWLIGKTARAAQGNGS
jgi:hypothetical protein